MRAFIIFVKYHRSKKRSPENRGPQPEIYLLLRILPC